MKRVFLYVRVSTEEQAIHGLSIEAQTNALEEWARVNGHKVAGTYVDAGISARKPAKKRPELQRLLADVQGGKGDLIVFTKLDRWFRNIAEYYKVQEILEQYHVDWRTIHEDYDTSTASGRLKINIMLSVAQDEADRTSERIKTVFESKRNKLEPLTGQMPFGYILSNKKIIKDPKTENAVNAFFQSYLSSGSISAAQRDVMEQFSLNIGYPRAHKMLGSRAYCGEYFGASGMTPRYITDEEFEKIQSMRRRNVRKSPKNRVFLFSGLTVCGVCGRRMGTRHSTTANYQYYTCPAPYLKLGDCENRVCMGEKKIEEYILGTLGDKIKHKKVEHEKALAARRGKNYKAEIANVHGKMSRLKELYVNDLISLDEYKADYTALTERLNELLELDQPVPKPNFKAFEEMLCAEWMKNYQGLGPERRRKILRLIAKEIRIYPDRRIEFDLTI